LFIIPCKYPAANKSPAGDLFAAGYLHGIINNMSSKESLLKGTEMSSRVIQQIGARL
tara:strand:- start:199 stop:369 length:171 start_codon:yes stop_codon:yes gene_type:complete